MINDELIFRSINRSDTKEMRFVAEKDAATPSLYDANHVVTEERILERLQFLGNKLAPDDFFEIVTKAGGSIIGFHVVRKSGSPSGEKIGSVVNLWVAEDVRRNGIARTLKERADNWARTSGIKKLETWVHKSNEKMLSLNEKLGFELCYYKLEKQL